MRSVLTFAGVLTTLALWSVLAALIIKGCDVNPDISLPEVKSVATEEPPQVVVAFTQGMLTEVRGSSIILTEIAKRYLAAFKEKHSESNIDSVRMYKEAKRGRIVLYDQEIMEDVMAMDYLSNPVIHHLWQGSYKNQIVCVSYAQKPNKERQ